MRKYQMREEAREATLLAKRLVHVLIEVETVHQHRRIVVGHHVSHQTLLCSQNDFRDVGSTADFLIF